MKIVEVNAGDRFGRLTILKEDDRIVKSLGTKNRVYRTFLCLCDCGSTTHKLLQRLRAGKTRSCGCLNDDPLVVEARRKKPTHNHSHTSTYGSWTAMKTRCTYAKHPAFARYSKLGFCGRWKRFENFLEDMGERPEGKTLDRIDTRKGYSKSNCRWATVIEQMNNMKSNRRVTYAGQSHTVSQLSQVLGMSHATLTKRLNAGWCIEKIAETPVGYHRIPAHGEVARYKHHKCRCRLCIDAVVSYNKRWTNKRQKRNE